jgi:hypothetical protein
VKLANHRGPVGLVKWLACLLALSALSMPASACAPAQEAAPFTIELITGDQSAQYNPAIDEKDCYIARCTSISESEGKIFLTTTKSKDARILALLFVKPPAEGEKTAAGFWVAPRGPETNYNISGARFFKMSATSARAICSSYAITYDNWIDGATGSAEKFPCCQ